jgi:hypothetical protein
MDFSKQSTHEWHIKMQIMAKIARRIEQLKQHRESQADNGREMEDHQLFALPYRL